jgi:flagellar assembly protein FliH
MSQQKNQPELLHGRYRLHQFPPLHRRQLPLAQGTEKEFQKQLMDGFQVGLSKGFDQGLEQAREQGLAEGRRQGHSEGYRDGYAEGSLCGQQKGLEEFIHAARPLEVITQQVHDYLAHYQVQQREELLQLVDKVTRQVIRCELALHPTQLLALVEEALEAMPQPPSSLRVYLNPEEFQRIKDSSPQRVSEWGLMALPELAAGECRVVTESTEIDVGCEHRLQQCITVLKQSLLPEGQDE